MRWRAQSEVESDEESGEESDARVKTDLALIGDLRFLKFEVRFKSGVRVEP